LQTAEETAPPPGLRFAPVYYLNEAVKILCWDDEAVRRASKDNNSLLYRFLILLIAPALPLWFLVLRDISLKYEVPWVLIASRYATMLLSLVAWIFLQIGLSHILAKTLFDAKGSYLEIMRAYMLGQMFPWLIVVPIAGGLLTEVGGIAVPHAGFRGGRRNRADEGVRTCRVHRGDLLVRVDADCAERNAAGSIGSERAVDSVGLII
jgi:hypothetical protein